MPAVQACVLTFLPMAGTGTQTVTGVVDQDGNAFIATVFLFQSGYAAINTVTSAPGGAYPFYANARGVDTGAVRSLNSTADAHSAFNFKSVASGQSLGDHSIIDQWADNFNGAQIYRAAYVSAVRSGEFDVTYDLNLRNGDTELVLALGGDGLDIAFTNTINGTYTTPSKPQGILALPTLQPSSGGPTAGGAGGQNIPWGFATRDGIYGASNLNVVNQGENWSGQRVDAFSNAIDDTIGTYGALPTISAWTDTSFTLASGSSLNVPMPICGEDVRTAGGVLTQPIVTGDQTFSVGDINARVVFIWSVGQVASTSVSSGAGQLSTGWATPTAQVGYWCGERMVGNAGPSYGVRYESNSSIVRFGLPDGASTTFHSVAAVTDIDQELGTITLNWSVVDGTARQLVWFVIGEAFTPPPPPPEPIFHTRDVVRRRLRRSPIVWSEKDGLQTRVRINLFAVDMQPGVGTRDTPDPLVMIRASKDGGYTWGNERIVSAGRVGEYFDRLNSWQWGQGRDWVFEVACTDPVTWNLLNAYIDAEGGTS